MIPPASTLSVIIPAYNSAGFIGRAIESVFAQTVPVHELIVVDDGSSDDTSATAAAFGPRVKVLRQPNGGPGAARNHGVRESRGEWLAFLDADDAWVPSKIERQRPHLVPGTDIVFSHVVGPLKHDNPRGDITFDLLWDHNLIGMSTAIIRRESFRKVAGFDEDRAIMGVEDYNLWLRLAAQDARFVFLADELVEYTPAPGNLSSQFRKIAAAAARNAEKVASIVGLSDKRLSAKLSAIYEEYGVALLHARCLPQARECLRLALRHRPDHRNAVRWLSTFAPRRLLDLKRNLRSSLSQFLS